MITYHEEHLGQTLGFSLKIVLRDQRCKLAPSILPLPRLLTNLLAQHGPVH